MTSAIPSPPNNLIFPAVGILKYLPPLISHRHFTTQKIKTTVSGALKDGRPDAASDYEYM